MTLDTARSRRLWDRIAPRYDQDMRRLEPLLFGRDARPLVCAQAHGDVLDIAIGTGLNLPHYPSGVRLTGGGPQLGHAQRRRQTRRRPRPDRGTVRGRRRAPALQRRLVRHRGVHAVAVQRRRRLGGDRRDAPGPTPRRATPAAGPCRRHRLWEKVTLRFAGDYQTRHPLPLVERAGLVVTDSRRTKLGTVERLRAIKPTP